MVTSRRSLLRFLLWLAYLGVAVPAQTVLCVAPGGHLAIEVVRSLSCHPGSAAGGIGVASAADDGCPSECTDTPLWAGVAIRDEQTSVRAAMPHLIAAPGVGARASAPPISATSRVWTSAAPAALNASRSVILRC
jgi:hypothetical protein